MIRRTNTQPRPLAPWGSFSGEIRFSDSPYIESVWEGIAFQDCTHLTAADGAIDFVVSTKQGTARLLLSGPTSKAWQATFNKGDKILAIRLRPGVHLPFITGTKLANMEQFLPTAGQRRFWLNGTALHFPGFNDVETFADRLARLRMLRRDIVIEDMFAKRSRNVGPRTVQRHALATTGLTMNQLLQIKRAERARTLLESGRSLTSIAFETGYSDTSHMAHAFRHFFGKTPGELRRVMTRKSYNAPMPGHTDF